MSVVQILKVHATASVEQHVSGLSWYDRANALAIELAGDLRTGAGVIAALSPNCSWDQNQKIARLAFETGVAGGTFGDATRKANRILDGEDPDAVLGGLKVRSFFLNIVDPSDPIPVTIDRHAHSICVGEPQRKGQKIGKRLYAQLSDEYREAADTLGILPQQVQAVTWERWREMWAWRKTEKLAA